MPQLRECFRPLSVTTLAVTTFYFNKNPNQTHVQTRKHFFNRTCYFDLLCIQGKQPLQMGVTSLESLHLWNYLALNDFVFYVLFFHSNVWLGIFCSLSQYMVRSTSWLSPQVRKKQYQWYKAVSVVRLLLHMTRIVEQRVLASSNFAFTFRLWRTVSWCKEAETFLYAKQVMWVWEPHVVPSPHHSGDRDNGWARKEQQ